MSDEKTIGSAAEHQVISAARITNAIEQGFEKLAGAIFHQTEELAAMRDLIPLDDISDDETLENQIGRQRQTITELRAAKAKAERELQILREGMATALDESSGS